MPTSLLAALFHLLGEQFFVLATVLRIDQGALNQRLGVGLRPHLHLIKRLFSLGRG